jgi:KipI family sensor histidine kinase inhibitor
LIVEFGDRVDWHLSALVLVLAQKLEAAKPTGVIEAVPTFRSLMVHYDPLATSHADLQRAIAALLPGLEARSIAGRRWRIPACYDPSLGLDLAEVGRRTGLSPSQVVERHSQTSQLVYMMGFLPGLPYLGDLAEAFALPRRENPRLKVPSGSVAIAMSMTVIYPQESPGGWHILARTPVRLWQMRKAPPALLAAGDQVTFAPLSLREYERMLAKAAAAELCLAPEGPQPQGRGA